MQPKSATTIKAHADDKTPAQEFFYDYVGHTIIGVHDHERDLHQAIEISATITATEFSEYFSSFLESFLADHRPFLLETLAYELALHIMEIHDHVVKIDLTIRKPDALKNARAAYANIVMQRD